MSPLSVNRVDPWMDSRWEEFVTAHPEGLVYHLPSWLDVLRSSFGYEAFGLTCQDGDGRLLGVLPLLSKRGLVTGRQLSSLPHTPIAGPLALNRDATSALIKAATDLVPAKRRAWLLLKLPPTWEPISGGVTAVPWRMTYVLELPPRAEQLQFGTSRNHRKIRSAVRKAARDGVEVRPAEIESELGDWYELYLQTLRRRGIPPLPYRFFQKIWELLRPNGWMRLLLAEQVQGSRRTLLAGSLYLMFGKTIFFAFNGRAIKELSFGANDAIKWEALHLACEEGFRHFDLGEVSEGNESLARFKRKWGTEARQLYRYYYPASRELEGGALNPTSTARDIITAGWQRLPLSTTRLLGYWLYRYL